jgi:hypothetical protein
MTVKVFSGVWLVDEFHFETEKAALEFASGLQDAGFKVRVDL